MANFIGRHVRKRNRLVIIHLTKPYNLSINNKKMKQIQEKQTNKKQKLIIYLITVQLATRQPIICQPRHLMWNEHFNNGANLWRETETWKPTKVLLVVIWRPNNCPTDNIATPAPVLLLLLYYITKAVDEGGPPPRPPGSPSNLSSLAPSTTLYWLFDRSSCWRPSCGASNFSTATKVFPK